MCIRDSYQDLRDEWRNKKHDETKEDITDDVVFEVELIRQVEINIDSVSYTHLSVGADAVQPSSKINTNIITNSGKQINLQAAKKSNNFGLNTVSMTELYDTVYPPRKPIVNDLLYSGTYLFVGAPKVGKSFFMGQLAYHVAMGLPLWEYEVHQGTVLYLALEDDYARLQRRLSRMFGVEETSNLYFATQAKSVSEGLDQQLEGFIREHPDVRLIIIDTLQKVREIGGDRYSYASDYEIVTKLKTFSDRYGICLLRCV